MNRVNDANWNAVQPAILKELYDSHIANGTTAGRDGQRPKELEAHIDQLVEGLAEKLNNGTYRFTPYLEMLKVKSAGKLPRVISIATARDRIVLRYLSNALSDCHEVPNEVPQNKIARIRDEFVGSQCKFDAFIKLDIKNFYPDIRHDLLEVSLSQKIRSTRLVDLVMRACRTPTVPRGSSKPHKLALKGVPQGLSISNVLAEIFLSDFDEAMRARADLQYYRFVDDILIFCRSADVSVIENQIRRKLISDLGVTPHPRLSAEGKSAVGILGLEEVQYLGYVFKQSETGKRLVSIRRSSRVKHENSIVRVFTDYKYRASKPSQSSNPERWKLDSAERCEWWLNFVITGCTFDNERRGWIQYFSKSTDYKLLNSLDNLVRKMVRDFGLEGVINPKSHRQAHRAINQRSKRRSAYIVNFDDMEIGEKFDILVKYFGLPESKLLKKTSSQIEAIFHSKMKWKISELDRDIGAAS